jgi:hypothetical protein
MCVTDAEPHEVKSDRQREATVLAGVMVDETGRSCADCGHGVPSVARFCGRCGAVVAADPPPTENAAPPSNQRSQASTPPAGVLRRHLLSGIGGLAVGLSTAGWWGRRRPQELDEDGWPTAELDLGDVDQLVAQAARDPVLYPAEGSARLAVLRWEPSHRSSRGNALERYGPEGEDHPVLSDTVGLMVVALPSPHCGCLVGWCATSRWFEGPCHGSRFNRWGEWTGGPAPRGLDRYQSRIGTDGRLIASLTRQIIGVQRDSNLLEQAPEGPACVDA